MAELEPQPNPVPEVLETVEMVYVTPPPNRPRKVSSSMWGTLEIAAVSASALIMVAVVMVYFFWVVPSNRELALNKSEADRLEAELISAKSKYGEITSTETQVGKLAASVDDFEMRFLPLTSNGQSALYQRLNGLIAAYGLVNTTGPDYSPLETVDVSSGQQTDEEKGRAKYRSLYPGVYVSTTLEGSYQNLRRFIREIETGRDFIVVSAVELAPTDTEKQKEQTNPNSAPNTVAVNPANPNSGRSNQKGFPPGFSAPGTVNQTQQRQRVPGKMHGETVSLHIELAAYFRRPNFVPASSGQ
ncbi:MAG: hypothetical protein ABIP78_10360 [Pyrinomonadaceae bacterium]